MMKNNKELKGGIKVGSIHSSNLYGDFKVVEIVSGMKIVVEFLNTGYNVTVQASQIRLGTIRDRLAPTVHGVGIIGDKYDTISGENKKLLTREYSIWNNMLARCYNEDRFSRNPTYSDCTVSENFKHYTYFYEWCQEQIGFNNDDWHLEKDILFKGNKIYSEDTCVFVPIEINNLFTTRVRFRGDSPIGVHFSNGKGKYVAQISDGKSKSNRTHLGLFDDEYSAFCAYKEAKEVKIKELAEKWKGKIDDRAYNALMNYQVEITD